MMQAEALYPGPGGIGFKALSSMIFACPQLLFAMITTSRVPFRRVHDILLKRKLFWTLEMVLP